jgi:hypothetical protein
MPLIQLNNYTTVVVQSSIHGIMQIQIRSEGFVECLLESSVSCVLVLLSLVRCCPTKDRQQQNNKKLCTSAFVGKCYCNTVLNSYFISLFKKSAPHSFQIISLMEIGPIIPSDSHYTIHYIQNHVCYIPQPLHSFTFSLHRIHHDAISSQTIQCLCKWIRGTQMFKERHTVVHYGPGVNSASNRNEYQEYFLGGGKGSCCVGLTTLPPSNADCLEIWKPRPPGTLRACPGL